MWNDYLFPATLEEALYILAKFDGLARIIAGGTDLVLQSQRGQCDSEVMVDITRIPDLAFLEEREGWIYIGPQVTHTQVANSLLIREKAGILAKACGCIGGPQIRHVATLAGNVVNALPAADGAVALLALDAEVGVFGQCGRRWISITDFYTGVGKCCVDSSRELVGAIRFRCMPARSGWSYQRLARRRTLVLPMLCTAVVVQIFGDTFVDAHIAIGPVAPIPFRAQAAEETLKGSQVNREVIARCAKVAYEASYPRDSALRGSGDYRKHMVEMLVNKGLEEAATKAGAAI